MFQYKWINANYAIKYRKSYGSKYWVLDTVRYIVLRTVELVGRKCAWVANGAGALTNNCRSTHCCSWRCISLRLRRPLLARWTMWSRTLASSDKVDSEFCNITPSHQRQRQSVLTTISAEKDSVNINYIKIDVGQLESPYCIRLSCNTLHTNKQKFSTGPK